MPIERTYQESHKYWCPKWYNPFDICTRVATVHKWCYEFSWVRETGYGFFSYMEGCENGTLYAWYAFSFLVFGSTTYPGGERCFGSPLSNQGRCAS